jgi:hypothetical protein
VYEYKDNYKDALIVNRLNSGRLSVLDGALVDGAQIIWVRHSEWEKNRPQRWTINKVGQEGGYHIAHIERSDNHGGTLRMALDADKPQVDSSRVKLKTPNDSDLQKWMFRADYGAESILHELVPYVDNALAMTVQGFEGNWGHIILSRMFSSADRLWYFDDASYKKTIPS